MGALHQGHISLIEISNRENDFTVCSIFVNPKQFNNAEDLKKYPRLIEKDVVLLQQNGCHVLFNPSTEEMYGGENQQQADFQLNGLDTVFEGEFRPGHFKGVATVVKKLFEIVEPHRAYFGQKDYQQVLVIKALARQMNSGIEIKTAPTLREENGLAMSSRNMRLTDEQRKNAAVIYKMLQWAKQNITSLPVEEIAKRATQQMNNMPDASTEYFAIADAETLQPVIHPAPSQKLVALAAVNFGNVRLIDNLVLN